MITTKKYAVPFVLITTLFFLWGFARAILDVLNQHFRDALNISIAESSLIQVTTYMGYFLMAIPAGLFINRYGYKKGVVFGLLLYAVGAFLFIPGSSAGTLQAFLGCLFIIACGLAVLETAANPYATELGPRDTAASRLNLSQSFNGLGSCLAPALVGGFLFSGGADADVSIPYIIMGVVVVVVAVIFSFSRLPEITAADDGVGEAGAYSQEKGSTPLPLHDQTTTPLPLHDKTTTPLLKNRIFIFGACALLAYEIAEISINSYFVLFTTGMGMLSAANASLVLSVALMFFMVGRFIGSWVMQKIPAERALYYCATGALVSMAGVIASSFSGVTWLPLLFLLANYVCEAIMFPTIFSLAIKGLGRQTKSASSILMMTPVGGCAFLIVGMVADSWGLVLPFIIPLLAFTVVWAYSRKCCAVINN